MSAFELVNDPAPGNPTTYNDSCNCPAAGSGQPVLLSIDAGSIDIICAGCRRSLEFLDDPELVSSDEIPMTLTYHDTSIHCPEVEYDGYWQLTQRATGATPDGAA
jgi:hypothetical protein